MASRKGFEPMTLRLGILRSIQLSYQDKKKKKLIINGAEGRTRTDTRLPLLDFESSASTSFTTPAFCSN